MVTYFNRKDLVEFGLYLLSEKRKARFQVTFDMAIERGVKNPIPVEESLKYVHHADVCNWMDESREKRQLDGNKKGDRANNDHFEASIASE